MLIRTSGTVQPSLHLLTLGHTCRYLIGTGRLTLTDPGADFHLPPLQERLASLGFSLAHVERVVVTHLAADRIGALPELRVANPRIQLTVTSAQAARLRAPDTITTLFEECAALRADLPAPTGPARAPLAIDEFAQALRPDEVVAESEIIECSGGIRMRAVSLPGHTLESVGYLIEPYDFLLGDEVLGYYRGRELAAPGCDASIEASLATLKKLEKLPIVGLGLPSGGVLTGELIRKHLQAVALNTNDLCREVKSALESGTPKELIVRSIKDSFFLSDSRDPVVLRSFERTFDALLNQLGLRTSPHE